MSSTPRIAVVGGGSWATAIVKMLLNNVDHVNWWVRSPKTADYIRQFQHNPNYLQSVELDLKRLSIQTDIRTVIEQSDLIFMVVPSAFIEQTFEGLPEDLLAEKVVFSGIKGIVPGQNRIPARYFHKTHGIPYENIGIVSGPCHAEEVALERLSYLTIACQDETHAQTVADLLECRYIKTSVSDDIFGTEFSAILKNIFAVACGICHGLGYGDNFQAVLISNALREIHAFVGAVHPIHRDVKSSAYLGDLLVTCYSNFSRNRIFGTMIGHGYSVKAAQLEMNMVAEGYYAAKSLMEINKKFEVDIPICETVYRILYERISPTIEMKLLTDKLT